MMTVETTLETMFNYMVTYIFGGNSLMTGLYIIFLILGFATALRIDTSILLLVLVPINIVFMATGLIPLAAGGLLILLTAFVFAFSWWQNK